MPSLTYIQRRKFISSLAVALVLLGGSFGLAKTASAAPPGHRETVPTLKIREHFAELEVDSGEVRNPLETLNLATALPECPSAMGGGRPYHQPPQP
jgi:hypothetical protein